MPRTIFCVYGLAALVAGSALAGERSQVIPSPGQRLREQERLQERLRDQADPDGGQGSGVNAKILRRQEREAERRTRVRRHKPKPRAVIVD